MKRMVTILAALLLVAVSGCRQEKPKTKAAVTFSGPPGMVVSLGGKIYNKLDFKMTPGRRIFKFTAPGYAPVWQKVVVKPEDRKLDVRIEMTPWRSAVLVTCIDAGTKREVFAKLICDGKPVGAAPRLITGIVPGIHKVSCSAKGYVENSDQWTQDAISPRPRTVAVELVSTIGKLRIQSEPAGAALTVGGNQVGVAPYSCELEAGKYEIVARMAKCQEVRYTAEVKHGGETAVILKLKPESAKLILNSRPQGAVVTVNGRKCGTTPYAAENLVPGNYRVIWTKSGFDPVEKTIEVCAGSAEEVSPELLPCYGSVKLSVLPAGVDVSIDGRPICRTEADPERKGVTKPVIVGELAEGKHFCILSHPRGNPPQKRIEFTVKKGEVCEVQQVTLWVANCTLVFRDNEPQEVQLISENENFLTYSPQRGIKLKIERYKVKEIRRMESDEK